MAATSIKAKLRPKRRPKAGAAQAPEPQRRKCPDCEVEIAISKIPADLVAHLRSVHKRTPSFDELNQFVPCKKPKKVARNKKRPKASKAKKLYVDRSIFAKKNGSSVTPEQKLVQDRINSRGFHEGAKVPGSNIRKIDK